MPYHADSHTPTLRIFSPNSGAPVAFEFDLQLDNPAARKVGLHVALAVDKRMNAGEVVNQVRNAVAALLNSGKGQVGELEAD